MKPTVYLTKASVVSFSRSSKPSQTGPRFLVRLSSSPLRFLPKSTLYVTAAQHQLTKDLFHCSQPRP